MKFGIVSCLIIFLGVIHLSEQAPSFISTPPSLLHPVENDNITLQWTYTLDGNPLDEVEITFTPDSPSSSVIRVARYRRGGATQVAPDLQDRFVVSLTNSQSTLTIHRTNRSDTGTHRLEVVPDSFSLAPIQHEVKISVKYAAQIRYTSGNKTLNETDSLNLACEADGNPKPNITWTRVSDNKPVSFPLIIEGKKHEGGYSCNASNGVGSPDSRIVYVFVQNHRPVNTMMTTNLTDNTVVVNKTFSITCSAQANPPAKYRFYKGIGYVNGADNDEVITTSVTERVKMVNYSCIPFNFYGNGIKGEIRVTVHYPALIESAPVNQTFREKDNATLHCNATGNPTPNITWSKDKSLSVLHQGDIYSIVNIPRDAAGNYTCTASNGVGENKKATAVITVHYPPSVTTQKEEVIVVEGHNTSLACDVSGKPDPTITWTRHGSSEVLSSTSSLDVIDVSRHNAVDDMMQFQCIASNGVGTPATATVNVTVHYGPGGTKLISVPDNTTVLRKSLFSLTCQADGSPEAQFHLYFNGSLVKTSRSGFFNVTVASDGLYTCVPFNTVGAGKNASVIVTAVDAPQVTVSPEVITVVEGSNLSLKCVASGKPKPSIKWTKVGSSDVLTNASLLTIVNVTRRRRANSRIEYQCIASNGVGTPAIATASITVNYPAVITNPGNETFVYKPGEVVSFSCSKGGYPTPTVTWTKDDVVMNWNSKDNPSKITFQVKESSPGWYHCKVENKLNTVFKWFHLSKYI